MKQIRQKISLILYVIIVLAMVSIFSNKEQIYKSFAATVSSSDVVDVTAVVINPNSPTGNGTSSGSQANSVTISGISFPYAKLTLLKDGQIATTLIARPDGSFRLVINGLNIGNYHFSVYAEDRDGITSSSYVANVNVSSPQGYTFSNVIIPPTISVNPIVTVSGQPVVVQGYAPPGAMVYVEVPGSHIFGNTIADSQGFYQYVVRANLNSGNYFFRTRAQVGQNFSLYSRPFTIRYYVGNEPIPPTIPSPYSGCVDYNKDRRVNLVDFSILLYWLDKGSPPRGIDCNADNRIDLKDFSILMYFWTG